MPNYIRLTEGTEALRATATKLDTLNDDFFSKYSKFYSIIDSELRMNWKGDDSDAFYRQAQNAKVYFEEMREILTEYSAFLRNTANSNDAREEDSRAQANAQCTFK